MADEYTNASGMTPLAMAEVLRGKYYSLAGCEPDVSWSGLAPGIKARWAAAIEMLFDKWERGVTSSFKATTEQFVDAIQGIGAFGKLSRPHQLLWEAVLRTAVNLVSVGRVTDFPMTQDEIEREQQEAIDYNWNDWLVGKMRDENLVPHGA